MEKMICPHCEKDLTEDATEKISKGENIVHCTIGGSARLFPEGSFTFAIITCPFCNKILGTVLSSPVPIPSSPTPIP